jgi:hypothetical protein
MVLDLRTKLAWRGVAGAYGPMDSAPTPVDEALLDGVETALREAYAQMKPFKARVVALPPGLRAFYLAAQDQLEPLRPREAFRFFAATWLPTDGLSLADEAAGDSTPWVEIGSFGPRRWVFVCVDTEDELYGAVVERIDSTPWSRMVYEDEVWPDMEAFLASLGR